MILDIIALIFLVLLAILFLILVAAMVFMCVRMVLDCIDIHELFARWHRKQ